MDEREIKVTGTCHEFWNTVKIYCLRPYCINKQTISSEKILCGKLKFSITKEECDKLCKNIWDDLVTSSEKDKVAHIENIEKIYFSSEEFNSIFTNSSGIYFIVRRLIPKKNDPTYDYFEVMVLDKEQSKLIIQTIHLRKLNSELSLHIVATDPLRVLKYNYIELSYNNFSVKIMYTKDLGDKGVNWLNIIFLPKFGSILSNLSNNCKTDSMKIKSNKVIDLKSNNQNIIFTNTVDVATYYKLYEKMKAKYAKNLIDNWTESTDPKKFVYEDIGIATYLMLLWSDGSESQEKTKKLKFIDLGCGNGLLVHILNSEGHLGVGLDLRKRKIWDSYHSKTILKEEIIIPTMNTSYSDADWLIGNHSDELTPWIPIMARRSNNHCQYFVLPCCPYELNGNKFNRKNSRLSSYQDFIHYVKGISDLCDFETYIDKLRIPSTKRVCLIGLRKPEMSVQKINFVNEMVSKFVNENCDINKCSNIKFSENNCPSFKIRESVEKVKNCTKLSQSLIDLLLKSVMNALLNEKREIIVDRNGIISKWNRGSAIAIGKLAETIDRNLLKKLKEENKGLQTLLKNHHYIFEVTKGGVQFRSPENLKEISSKFLDSGNELKWKKRSCWFYKNHPDKCPLSDKVCSYSHSF